MQRQAIELYITLSDKCNFECSHCLNNSGPKANTYSLALDEKNHLVELVNSNENITKVHFTGGEPTLELLNIVNFQKKITRKVEFSITTNGWFHQAPLKVLNQIKLNEIVISFDKFRKSFIKIEDIEKLIISISHLNYKIILAFVYENIHEIREIPISLKKLNIEIRPIHLLSSGRQTKKADHSSLLPGLLDVTCPSLDKNREHEKLHYIPSEGYTHCCGPLLWDKHNNEILMSLSLEKDPPISSLLRENTFSQVVKNLGLNPLAFEADDICSVCTKIFSKKNLPFKKSIYELITKEEFDKYFSISNTIDFKKIVFLLPEYSMTYAFLGKVNALKENGVTESFVNGIVLSEVKSVAKCDINEIHQFIIRTSVIPFNDFFPKNSIRKSLELFKQYLDLAPSIYELRKNNILVGLLIINHFVKNPYDGKESNHIGFVGYDKEMLTINEARYFKKIVVNKLSRFQYVSATIDFFNTSSIKFHSQIGLIPCFAKLSVQS